MFCLWFPLLKERDYLSTSKQARMIYYLQSCGRKTFEKWHKVAACRGQELLGLEELMWGLEVNDFLL